MLRKILASPSIGKPGILARPLFLSVIDFLPTSDQLQVREWSSWYRQTYLPDILIRFDKIAPRTFPNESFFGFFHRTLNSSDENEQKKIGEQVLCALAARRDTSHLNLGIFRCLNLAESEDYAPWLDRALALSRIFSDTSFLCANDFWGAQTAAFLKRLPGFSALQSLSLKCVAIAEMKEFLGSVAACPLTSLTIDLCADGRKETRRDADWELLAQSALPLSRLAVHNSASDLCFSTSSLRAIFQSAMPLQTVRLPRTLGAESAICSAFKDSRLSQLRELDVSESKAVNSRDFFESIPQFSRLAVLKMRNTGLSDVSLLINSLHAIHETRQKAAQPSAFHLDLSCNPLTLDAHKALSASGLPIESLVLQADRLQICKHKPVDAEGVKVLLESKLPLHSFDISFAPFTQVALFAQSRREFKELRLSKTGLTSESVALLATVKVRRLYIDGNFKIGLDGAKALGAATAKRGAYEFLDISGCAAPDEGIYALLDANAVSWRLAARACMLRDAFAARLLKAEKRPQIDIRNSPLITDKNRNALLHKTGILADFAPDPAPAAKS